ncbi:hypothetical protein AC578_2810 [Pseudocercospora eumusae]|uniref:Uncharacterized protein n=1 Tax=Pseudocercospora eumusae TaxID=321146 RepID=A0A139HGY2_9PEZI|nr:hypothetical protein AC578_2810 [Pseudocercospora eumusae]
MEETPAAEALEKYARALVLAPIGSSPLKIGVTSKLRALRRPSMSIEVTNATCKSDRQEAQIGIVTVPEDENVCQSYLTILTRRK